MRCHARSAKAGGFADRFDWGWRICGGAFQTVYLRRAQAAVNAGGKLRANDAGYKIMAVAVGPLTGRNYAAGVMVSPAQARERRITGANQKRLMRALCFGQSMRGEDSARPVVLSRKHQPRAPFRI